jgi:hypothetical protein
MASDKHAQHALRITVQDIRTARYCLAGVRPWFRRHGLDWQDFLARGIDAATLRATGDALVDPVIRAAEDRARVRPGHFGTMADTPNPAEAPDGR